MSSKLEVVKHARIMATTIESSKLFLYESILMPLRQLWQNSNSDFNSFWKHFSFQLRNNKKCLPIFVWFFNFVGLQSLLCFKYFNRYLPTYFWCTFFWMFIIKSHYTNCRGGALARSLIMQTPNTFNQKYFSDDETKLVNTLENNSFSKLFFVNNGLKRSKHTI